ncbi:MAG: D-2-hydroxyacid dehydrogenase [Zoogloea sp.]|uniref:D-2-hydroxyacid dehydrogenase n=1 Tax=Zoogloea sp. TaxID=49181 RepID=UPI0026216D77|nr:D-2-hydroxyacid dehydrogenase [Zoogloea sp.]MDD2988160.1 D-2-hydroxyacid dehydrogenase [Zoogloea sp.]
MHRIVTLEAGALIANIRRPAFAHEWVEYEATRQDDVAARLADATIAIVNKRLLTADILAGLPQLQMVAIAATGYNNIDLDACRARGIVVSNVRGYARETVPEHVFSLLLALSRQIGPFHRSVAAGRWQLSEQFCYFDYPIRDLHGRSLGLLGSGSLGEGVARLAQAFGMRVIRGERKGADSLREGYVAFDTLIREADVISLHCPLNAATRHLIGAAELAAMKPGTLLINTARGGLVDEAALADALRGGHIGGAAFDVLTEEPPRDNPLLAPDLLAAGNFILTPHVAWSSRDAMQTLADQLIGNIEAFVAGEARNRVA